MFNQKFDNRRTVIIDRKTEGGALLHENRKFQTRYLRRKAAVTMPRLLNYRAYPPVGRRVNQIPNGISAKEVLYYSFAAPACSHMEHG